MNITGVKIYRLEDKKMLALASITIDNELVVTGLKVLDGQNGIWVAMPNRKDSKNEYHDIVFPITKEARSDMQKAVLDKFNSIDDYADLEPKQSEEQKSYITLDIDEDSLPF